MSGLLARLRLGGALTVVSGATIALTACAGASTVHTDAMTATIVVVAGDIDSQVSVVLSADDQTSVELPTGDRVDASAPRAADARFGGDPNTVSEGDPAGSDTVSESSGEVATSQLRDTAYLGSHTYAGRLDGITTPSTDVSVILRREDETTVTSTVALPGPIFLIHPTTGEQVRRDRDLVMGVNAGAGSNRIEWSGPCVTEGSIDVDQGRPVVVPAGSVETNRDADPGAGCAVTFVVSRIFRGELDPAFAGGSITAQRSVSVSVTSVG